VFVWENIVNTLKEIIFRHIKYVFWRWSMKRVQHEKKYNLQGAIAPQYFSICEENIYYFDRINPYEGRFYCYDGKESRLLFEMGEGQGIFDNNGGMYFLHTDDTTSFKKLSCDGNDEKSFELDGMYYDFKINESGNYIFLGYKNGINIISIKNRDGIEIGGITLQGLAFASTLGLNEDYIYLVGFDEKNVFKLVKMNYIGNIERTWNIMVGSKQRLISKIELYKDYAVMLIGGAYDSIVILNLRDEKIKEINPSSLELGNFVDFSLLDGSVYILDGRNITVISFEDMLGVFQRLDYSLFRISFDYVFYQHIMFTKTMMKNIKYSLVPSLIISLAVYIFLIRGSIAGFDSLFHEILLAGSVFCIFTYIATSIQNILALGDKSWRIERLLEMYNGKGGFAELYLPPLYMSVVSFSLAYLLLYPPARASYSLMVAAIAMILSSAFSVTAYRRIKNQEPDIIVDLLKDDDIEVQGYIKTVVENLKLKKSEVLRIDILTFDGKEKLDIANRWAKTRKGIIRGDIALSSGAGNITAIIDLSKRDIRYSRFTIIMDYICYIKRKVNIKEIQIECGKERGI
jgi:hypothetical protein